MHTLTSFTSRNREKLGLNQRANPSVELEKLTKHKRRRQLKKMKREEPASQIREAKP